jgi:hypothetical protein
MNFRVVPRIPDQLAALKAIAYNTWWTWNTQAIELFRWIDSDLWESTFHNPVRLLGHVSQDRLAELSTDTVYLSHLEKTVERLSDYLERKTWFDILKQKKEITDDNFLVALSIPAAWVCWLETPLKAAVNLVLQLLGFHCFTGRAISTST